MAKVNWKTLALSIPALLVAVYFSLGLYWAITDTSITIRGAIFGAIPLLTSWGGVVWMFAAENVMSPWRRAAIATVAPFIALAAESLVFIFIFL